MDKNKAMDKARAALAIANDRAATTEEKDNALQMAKKLAKKYGFKIQQNRRKQNENGQKAESKMFDDFRFVPERPNKYILLAMGYIFDKAGYEVHIMKAPTGRKRIVGIKIDGLVTFYGQEEWLQEQLSKMYKELEKDKAYYLSQWKYVYGVNTSSKIEQPSNEWVQVITMGLDGLDVSKVNSLWRTNKSLVEMVTKMASKYKRKEGN